MMIMINRMKEKEWPDWLLLLLLLIVLHYQCNICGLLSLLFRIPYYQNDFPFVLYWVFLAPFKSSSIAECESSKWYLRQSNNNRQKGRNLPKSSFIQTDFFQLNNKAVQRCASRNQNRKRLENSLPRCCLLSFLLSKLALKYILVIISSPSFTSLLSFWQAKI